MGKAPVKADWDWFAAQPIEELAESCTKSTARPWARKAYAWLYNRSGHKSELPGPIDEPEGPPERLFPFLTADSRGNEGSVKFMEIDFSHTDVASRENSTAKGAQQAASTAASWFRQLGADARYPQISLSEAGVEGKSASLPAFILTLKSLIKGDWPDDFCATGCWNDRKFQTVGAETVRAKIEAAKVFGYRRLVVVEGQKIQIDSGLGTCRLTDEEADIDGIEIIEVSSDPRFACLQIVRSILGNVAGEALAEVLALFDQAAIRDNPADGYLSNILTQTEPFISEDAPLLARHVAHDIRARALLHAGRTIEAEREQQACQNATPKFYPGGWLGDYLRWGRVAHRAVLALDLGEWESSHDSHKAVEKKIASLGSDLDESVVIRESFFNLQLLNTRGRRYEFLGRLHQNLDLLKKSWDDRTRFQSYWAEIVEYAREKHLFDTTLHRQQNQCIDVIGSYWELEGHLPPDDWGWQDVSFWPDHEDVLNTERPNYFDIATWLRWQQINSHEVSAEQVQQILDIAAESVKRKLNRGRKATYPLTLLWEGILRGKFGTDEQRRTAAEMLARSELFDSELSEHSILTILAIRAEKILQDYADGVPVTTPNRPHAGSKLALLADDLLSKPEKIVARCPY